MFEKIEIWKRISRNYVARYQCLKRISDGMFAVQNKDSMYLPVSVSSIANSNQQFIELFMDDDPSDRCEWFFSLVEAIDDHDAEFD